MMQQPVPLPKQYLHWIYWKTTLRYFNWGLCPHQFYSKITCYVHVCLINHSHFTYKRKLLKYLITGKVLHVLYIIFRVQTYKIQIHNIKLVTLSPLLFVLVPRTNNNLYVSKHTKKLWFRMVSYEEVYRSGGRTCCLRWGGLTRWTGCSGVVTDGNWSWTSFSTTWMSSVSLLGHTSSPFSLGMRHGFKLLWWTTLTFPASERIL